MDCPLPPGRRARGRRPGVGSTQLWPLAGPGSGLIWAPRDPGTTFTMSPRGFPTLPPTLLGLPVILTFGLLGREGNRTRVSGVGRHAAWQRRLSLLVVQYNCSMVGGGVCSITP